MNVDVEFMYDKILYLWCTINLFVLAGLFQPAFWVGISVADPHHFDSDPVPAFHFDADPDSTFHSDADPDPTIQFDADPDPAPK